MPWYNPTDPTQRNWMLGGIFALVAILPYNMYILSPRQDANLTTQADVERLQGVNRRAGALSARGGTDLEDRLAIYQRHVDRLEELIPASDEVPVLLDDINARARQYGVVVDELTPESPEPAGPYDRRAYSMGVIGEYHSVARFLTAIANLSRIVTPVEVDVELYNANAAQYPDLQSPVRATFRIETYVFANRPAQPAAAQVGG